MRPGILLHSLHSDCGRFGLISQPLWPWEPQEIIQYLIVHWWYFFLGATPEKINALPSVLGLFVLLCHGATVWRLHSCTTVIWDRFSTVPHNINREQGWRDYRNRKSNASWVTHPAETQDWDCISIRNI